jgi:S-adenosyl-L-methionine hydrolase (adenosine-forming)
MARPVVALLTDFGTADHYVAAMKGVLLGICADATLVDLTHHVPRHDILAGALELSGAYRFFPAGTIFLAVIDPGVGSARRAVAVEAGEYRFVAPDNGVLTCVLSDTRPTRSVELTEPRYARPGVSRTFEGRDRFAPAAGWLASGVDLAALGAPVATLVRLDLALPRRAGECLEGDVMRVDRFGNLVTNITRAAFDDFRGSADLHIEAGTHRVEHLVATYADAPPGVVCALFGSTEHLEIACNGESAHERLRLGRGALVRICRVPAE